MQPVKPVLPARVACLLAWILILARVAMTAGCSGVEPADILFGAYTWSYDHHRSGRGSRFTRRNGTPLRVFPTIQETT